MSLIFNFNPSPIFEDHFFFHMYSDCFSPKDLESYLWMKIVFPD